MAMKSMVERDCGGVNPLMNLTSQLAHTSSNLNLQLADDILASKSTNGKVNTAPTTFDMHALLSEMQHFNDLQHFPQQPQEKQTQQNQLQHQQVFQQPSLLANPIIACDWLKEFHDKPITIEHSSYDLPNQSDNGIQYFLNDYNSYPHQPLPQQFHPLPQLWGSNLHLRQDFQFFKRFANEESTNGHDVDGRYKDRGHLEKFFNNLDLVVNKNVRGVVVGDDGVAVNGGSRNEDEINEMYSTSKHVNNKLQQNLNNNDVNIRNNIVEDDDYDGLWSDMQNKWKELADSYTPSWEHEFWTGLDDDFDHDHYYKAYKFDEDNILLDPSYNAHESANNGDDGDVLSEGLKRLREGDVANAVLFLEAAVKKDPDDSEAWFYLGTAQADNEQEPLAIAAFNKCLELNPTNLKALMSLAVGFTNESLPHRACKALRDWLAKNDKYSSLIGSDITDASKSSYKNHTELLDLYLEAVHMSPNQIDPDVQIGMGVLFNLSGEYSKAVDCFKTALQVSPEDSMLWNKLGATLANGQKSEEAIDAYHRALHLRPGYVRTRFNLGVACVNLGAYREAVEHFLSALTLKSQTSGPKSNSKSNNNINNTNIWSSLRMALSLLGRNDLLASCDKQLLNVLNDEFKLN